ncbi:MAG: EAL domain-containing protein [Firmicutes bacterium]|nr:EAL domain-containing protein [Bacillota bacterium]
MESAMDARYEQLLNGLLDPRLDEQLELRFQPVVGCRALCGVGVEALLRWCHPQLGWVSPEEFIAIAEQHALMRRLTLWVIKTSFNYLQRWLRQGMCVELSMNVSMLDLESNYLLAALRAAAEHSGVPPAQVIIELTETAGVQNPVFALRQVKRIQRQGFHVALDDFGSGHAGLLQLAALPVNRVKIDRCIVQACEGSWQHQRVLIGLIEIAHQLGVDVVAEGVENAQVQALLNANGCDYVQGYFIASPLTVEEFKPWYQQQIKTHPKVRCAYKGKG